MLIGFALVPLTGVLELDPLIAALVAVNILWTGYAMIRDSVGALMDEAADPETVARIKALVGEHAAGAIEAHDVRTRTAGHVTFVSFDLVVPTDMPVGAAHDICDRVEAAIRQEMGVADISIHLEPAQKPSIAAFRCFRRPGGSGNASRGNRSGGMQDRSARGPVAAATADTGCYSPVRRARKAVRTAATSHRQGRDGGGQGAAAVDEVRHRSTPPSPAYWSIRASSSAENETFASASSELSSCCTVRAPTSAEVTRGSRIVQASAICARDCPRARAMSLRARTRARFASPSHRRSSEVPRAARASGGTPSRYLSVSMPCASGENAMQPIPQFGQDRQQFGFDPAIEHRVAWLVDQQPDALAGQDLVIRRVRSGE